MAKQVAVSKDTIASYEILTVNELGNGRVTVSRSDGQVLSIQPDGTHEWRPAGTVGAYEQATMDGKFLIYYYRDASGVLRYHKLSLDESLPSQA